MTLTATVPFEDTIQTTNLWLSEIMARLGWHDPHRGYHALQVVLHALRDRLSLDDAVAVGSRLPALIRGLYYDGWLPGSAPQPAATNGSFAAAVAAAYRDEPQVDARHVALAVFHVLGEHIGPDEIPGLKRLLAGELGAFWPSSYLRSIHVRARAHGDNGNHHQQLDQRHGAT